MNTLKKTIGALALNARFVWYGARLYRGHNDVLARRMFVYSIQYLAMLFALMLIDHYRAQYAAWLGWQ